MTDRLITPVILSGGSGTRLWPLSREERPKQLLPLVGPETMLQMTARRVADRSLFGAPIIVANERHAEEILTQFEEIGEPTPQLILEPCPRNTAPAIALAALDSDADALLLVMPSDHLIARPHAFVEAVRLGVPAADDGWLVTFGIAPDRPETGYGYIRRGEQLCSGVFHAEAFVEKPDRATAAAYIASGGYDWNGGIFLFRADAFLDALGRHDAAILSACRAAIEGAERRGSLIIPAQTAFAGAPSHSIDYAVMEKADRVAVVPVDMQWSDIGNWDALYDISTKDAVGNAMDGKILAIDSSNCLLRSEGPVVAAVGVKDLIVIATADAILILPRGRAQQIREVVEAVKVQGLLPFDRNP